MATDDHIPSHTELESRLVREGIIGPILDPADIDEDDEDVQAAFAARRNGNHRETTR